MEKPSREDKVGLKTPFVPLNMVLAYKLRPFRAAQALTKLAGTSAAPIQGAGCGASGAAALTVLTAPHPQTSLREEERHAEKPAADGPELRAESFKHQLNGEYVVKAFQPKWEGSTGVT